MNSDMEFYLDDATWNLLNIYLNIGNSPFVFFDVPVASLDFPFAKLIEDTEGEPGIVQNLNDQVLDRFYSIEELTNNFLRIDFEGFFDSISEWYGNYRRHAPVIVRDDPRSPDHLDDQTNGEIIYLNSDEDRPGIDYVLNARKQLKAHVDQASSVHSNGDISAQTKMALYSVCQICLGEKTLEVLRDPLYYARLFKSWGHDCARIQRLFNEVISRSTPASLSKIAASTFDSFLGIHREGFTPTMDLITSKHPEASSWRSYSPVANFPNIDRPFELNMECSQWTLSISICSVILFESESICRRNHLNDASISEEQSARELTLLILDYPDRLIPALRFFINLGSQVLSVSTKHFVDPDKTALLEKVVKRAQRFSNEEVKLIPNKDGSFSYEYRERSYSFGDSSSLKEYILDREIISLASSLYEISPTISFPHFLSKVFSIMLHSDIRLKYCKNCGKPYYSSKSNSQYCDRFDSYMGRYCNPQSNDAKRVIRVSPHSTAINLKKKAETAKSKAKTRWQKYFLDLADSVDHAMGHVYRNSPHIDGKVYRDWLRQINKAKTQPSNQTPDALEYPRPVIWFNKVEDGNALVHAKVTSGHHPALIEGLDLLASDHNSTCTKDRTGWTVSRYELIKLTTKLNRELAKTKKLKNNGDDSQIMIPGIDLKQNVQIAM